MKQNRSRLIALLLALCLLVGALPTLALADDTILTMDDYQNAKTRVEEALTAPDVPVEQTNQHYVARSSEVDSIVKSTVTGELSVDSATAFALPVAGRLVLRAPEAEAYRWQIRVGDQWANIVGDTDPEMTLTYAKLQNALSGNAAVVRCALTRAGETVYTAEATVTVDPKVETETTAVTEQIPVTSYYQPSAVSRAKALNEGVMAANDAPVLTNYTIIINYKFEDGTSAANSWTATVAKGSSYSTTVTSPTVVGYEPDKATVEVNVTDIQEDKTYTVTYKPALVNYTVNHYQQNIPDDKYALVDTEKKSGFTDKEIGTGLEKSYDGFTALLYDTATKIAADGSTVVEIYYDRNYYLLSLDLDGGYGAEPVYARYGATITVANPEKAGYTFNGWNPSLPETMPDENMTAKALWEANGTAKVTVVIWGENANDENYSYYKNAEIMAKPGEKLTLNDLQGKLICGKEEHTHSEACYSCGHKGDHVRTLECYGINSDPVDPNNGYGNNDARTHFEDQCDRNGCKGLKQYLKDGSVCRYKNGYGSYYENFYFLYLGGQYYEITQSQYNSWKTSTGKRVEHGRDTYYVYEGKANICQHTHTDSCYDCGKEEHTHTSACYYNTSFMDKPELWKLVSSDEVTVAADGTTILNVYYDRVEFTLTFRVDGSTVKTITGKWGTDIKDEFPIKGTNGRNYNGYWWQVPTGSITYDAGKYLLSIDMMPKENIIFSGTQKGTSAKLYYYVEKLSQDASSSTDKELDGISFKLYKPVVYSVKQGTFTEKEEFYEIPGFEKYKSDPSFANGNPSPKDNNYFYYVRKAYTLKFYNYNVELDETKEVKYEDWIKNYLIQDPRYPDGLEPNAYTFEGWYTDQFFKNKVSDTTKMPANDVMLYAKWVPVNRTVNIYLTKDAMDGKPMDTWTVPHGKVIAEDERPETPTNGNYTFVGWFYEENGVEKAFDFSMPVTKDLNLYAKWSSNKLVEYTIRYKLNDENGVEIAAETKGSALAGTTKTFNAKTGTQLNEGYQTGYFPKTNSHSIKMNIEGGNEFTFIYVHKEKVKYTVRYLDRATGEPVVVNGAPTPDKNAETSDAVITEKFVQVSGYAPDAYQKRLVLSATESENVITFWYTKDDTHAPVQIIHWTQNIAGDGYTEYQSSTNLNGEIDNTYTQAPLDIPGFTYNANPTNPVDGYPALASGKLTEAGLVLNLYYDRIEYPYAFKFLEQGTDKELAEPVTGNARYQAQVTQPAKTIPGYTLVSSKDSEAIIIAIEDPADKANKNVRTFYYTEQSVDIKYQVVGPTGCGTLDNYQESQLKVTTGEVKGSKPAAAEGFKFVGWYKDQGCTQPVDAAWVADSKLTPGKTKNYGTAEKPVMGYEAATYYAKFEHDVADLTITKRGWESIDENQSFIFKVTGPGITGALKVVIEGNKSVTIKGLKVGKYTVTEVTDWSWRYEPKANGQTITLKPMEDNTVTFMNDRTETKWLGGDAYEQNKFEISANASTN